MNDTFFNLKSSDETIKIHKRLQKEKEKKA